MWIELCNFYPHYVGCCFFVYSVHGVYSFLPSIGTQIGINNYVYQINAQENLHLYKSKISK